VSEICETGEQGVLVVGLQMTSMLHLLLNISVDYS